LTAFERDFILTRHWRDTASGTMFDGVKKPGKSKISRVFSFTGVCLDSVALP
jgi:hypothetical protein